MRRRVVTAGLAVGMFTAWRPARGADAGAAFDQLLAEAAADAPLLESGRSLREGRAQVFEQVVTMGVRGRPPRSALKVSDRANKLIQSFEISSAEHYDQSLQAPIWPHGESGVTIGMGYDLGYATAAWVREDWSGFIADAAIDRLDDACEVRGPAAAGFIAGLADIRIPYVKANEQFVASTLPRAVGDTVAGLPNAEKLSPDSLGALVSLVYNRGPSFQLNGKRYSEMRAIRLHMVRNEPEKIPAEIRGMKHLWEGVPNMNGLLTRRELEARLFEAGM